MASTPYTNQLGGANTNLSPFLQPANSPTILNGVNCSYKLGALLKDLGYERVGDAASSAKAITGAFNFRQSAATQKILRTKNTDAGTNLTLQYNNSGTWTTISGLSTTWDAYEDSRTEFESFIGYCFIVGYDSTDGVWLPPGSVTGTTFSPTVNVGSMPNAKYIKRYRDRLYLGSCYYSGAAYPYRIYFSSIPTAGAITWTPASDFIDVDFSEEVTGLGCLWDRLVIFTELSAYFYDQSTFKKQWELGGYHRTIANYGPMMYFANPIGLWRSSGGQPENISGPIIDLVRTSLQNGYLTSWTGAIVDEEYNWYLGTCSANGVTYTNCMATFNIPTQTWRWRELYHAVSILVPYMASGVQQLYMGTTGGEIYRKGKYTDSTILTSDAGFPIHGNFELAPMYMGNMEFTKNMTKITTFANRAMGLRLKARVINRESRSLTPYVELGEVTQYVQHHHISTQDGVLLQIAGYEYGSNPYWSFYGFSLEADLLSEVLK